MNLQGSITEIQDTVLRLYLQLEEHFKENQIIRDLWTAMAHDVAQQKRSMIVLAPSFWHQLKEEMEGTLRAISEETRKLTIENKEDHLLKSCLDHALSLEEPTILKIYVPIIRKLRENWTDRALDFYIMVKAHLARITRVTQSFAGDPVVIQRANLLLQRFEKEVQEPSHIAVAPKQQRAAGVPNIGEKHAKKPAKKVISKPAATLAKHAKAHHKRTKPLVEKILPRRRARR
jgi:hypothetical protein